MKKILMAVGLVSLVALSSQAQGLIIFSSSTQNMSTNNVAVGKTVNVANQYYYALFVSAASTTVGGSQTASIQGTNGVYAFNDNNWTYVAAGGNTAIYGRFAASSPNTDFSTTVSGIAAGSSAQFVVVGWSASLGSTYSAFQTALATAGTTGLAGESAVSGSILLGNGGLLPTQNLFGGGAPQIQAFTMGAFTVASVAPVPEPGTMALAALGGASLLLFRRRNK